MADFDKKHNIINQHYPPICLLKAKYKQTFAYSTLHERIPSIYSNLIGEILAQVDEIVKEFGEESRYELHNALEQIKELVDELKNDETLTELYCYDIDKELWNNFLSNLPPNEKTYFTTCWLWAECYLYRRLKTMFEGTKYLKDFDYFKSYKQTALIGSLDVISILFPKVKYLFETKQNTESLFKKFLYLDLWGNKCDLSLSDGHEVKQFGDQFGVIEELKQFILIDKTNDIWNLLSKQYSGERMVDIVCDNAGYELFTDLLLADFLIEKKLATKVRFHTKAIPWFISDTMPSDFHWTLRLFKEHESTELSDFGKKWTQYLEQGKFCLLKPDRFWVSPYEFYRMKEIAPKLYQTLAEAHLVIIKGDLNYRKLLGDFSWSDTEDFETCLRGFCPTNICSLRTIKADLICGLNPGMTDLLFERDPNWMITGEYATIQLSKKKNLKI